MRVREKIWRSDYVDALADIAEAGEISRRLYLLVQERVNVTASASRVSTGYLRTS
jgi:hypothetical protein